jgi:dihydroorotate dehydrogenase electron transfer subunit
MGAGVFLLARAESGDALTRPWENYLRVPLFPTRIEVRGPALRVACALLLHTAPAHDWLLSRTPGDEIDVLGPLGNGFTITPHCRNLLLVGDAATAGALLPLAGPLLDRGGRVTVLMQSEAASPPPIRDTLPLAVELHVEAKVNLLAALGGLSAWADQIALCLPAADLSGVARTLRASRFRLDVGFAQALVITPLPCGCGACLACLTPLANGGFTRACVHGPVFDLTRLA